MTENNRTKKTRPTMLDVAALANVSVATVSNTINNTRRVDDATRERVENAIRDLGYIRNMGARRFRTGRTNMLAVLSSMPSAVAQDPSRLGLSVEIAASAAQAAMLQGNSLILVPPTSDPEQTLGSIDIDGSLLIEPPEDDPFLELLQNRQIPFVCIGQPVQDNLPYVDLHYERIADLLLNHMTEQHGEPFALICGQTKRMAYDKMVEAYTRYAGQTGMKPIVFRLPESGGEAGARDCTRALLRNHPDLNGILVPIDAFASGAMAALSDAGVNVPGEIRIATRYDGTRAREATPQLTAVNMNLDEVARIAVDMLLEQIEHQRPGAVQPAPQPTLIPRESTRLSYQASGKLSGDAVG